MQSSSFSPGTQQHSASDRPSNHPSNQPSSSLPSVSTSDSENVPLSSEARVKRKKASSSKRDTEQSLYSWFSSPVASPRSSDQDASLLDNQEHAVSTGITQIEGVSPLSRKRNSCLISSFKSDTASS